MCFAETKECECESTNLNKSEFSILRKMKSAYTWTCTRGFIMGKHVSWSFYLVVFFFLQKSKKTEQCFGIYFEPTDEVQIKL